MSTLTIELPDDKVAVANIAINLSGGPVALANQINDAYKTELSRDVVQKWRVYGVTSPWYPMVHELTGIPLSKINPEVYPERLFG